MWCAFYGVFPAQLSPEFEELQVSVMGLRGVFKIDKGIDKTGGLHKALGLSAFRFFKTKLVSHDVADLIDNGFWNTYSEANGVEMLVDAVAGGIKGGAALFYFFSDKHFMIFAKDKSEEEGRVDA